MEISIQPNPGGELTAEQIIGREDLTAEILHVLKRQSLVLTAERRIGKTAVMKTKLRVQGRDKFTFKYHDLENIHSAAEFAEVICRDVRELVSIAKRISDGASKARKQVGKVSVGEIGVEFCNEASSWKERIESAFADIERNPRPAPLVFLWDELPMMIENIRLHEDASVAMAVLDTLRAMRQSYPSIRMIYTGSIGLHHVLKKLGNTRQTTTNDMYFIDVPPLAREDAEKLARALLKGANINTEHHYPIARVMSSAVDNIPYYIHHLADQMRSVEEVTIDSVERIIRQSLVNENDLWQLHHYEQRISTYYEESDHPLILALLDIFSAADEALRYQSVYNLLKAHIAIDDEERVRDLLLLLCRDHYLIRETDGRYRFRYTLIQRWWRTHRDVEAPV